MNPEETTPQPIPQSEPVARGLHPWHRLPRLETVLLLVGLACTVYGKYVGLRQRGDLAWDTWATASASDVAFFSGLAILWVLLRASLPARLAARLPTLLALPVCAWSVANMAWLIATGVQIHIAVFASLYHDPAEFGDIVFNRMTKARSFTLTLFGATICMGAFVVFRLVRPDALRNQHLPMALRDWRNAIPILGLAAALATARPQASVDPRLGALSYSSHWFAMASLAGFDGSMQPDRSVSGERVARQGERVVAPPPAGAPRPNIVLVVLESTALWSTSLGGQPPDQTPTLVELARRGAWFERTRAVVTHTTQSQFSLLTGVSPSLEGDFVEAVLLDRPYETLATILRANGYRTRFSQMVRASFECNPGLVANLGFESFWAREDARDPSAHLGYFSGDDFKMLGPAFEWLDEGGAPALLFLMTSVAHHPYEAPAWFGPELTDVEQAYLQTVRYTDAFVAKVVELLKARGLFEDTLLCIVADHGEGVGRNGVMQHNSNPYEESLRVPWIVTWPSKLAAQRVVRENCTLMDVTPTLLSLLGYDVSGAGFEGADALADLPANRRLHFNGWYRTSPCGYLEGEHKYTYWPSLGKSFRVDLAADPDERRPVALDVADSDALRKVMSEWRARNRISFNPKRYRERLLFDRWQTFALGDMAWCYYVEDGDGPHDR